MPSTAFAVEPLNHRERSVAEHIHAVQLAAYKQEAQFLGVSDFPPLQRTVANVQASAEQFFGSFLGGVLVGIVAVEPSQGRSTLCISSLVVAPAAQRCGVGSALLGEVLRRFASNALVVSTASANARALALYERFGFVALGRRFVGTLELVQLERPSSNPSIEGTSSSKLRLLPAAPHVKR